MAVVFSTCFRGNNNFFWKPPLAMLLYLSDTIENQVYNNLSDSHSHVHYSCKERTIKEENKCQLLASCYTGLLIAIFMYMYNHAELRPICSGLFFIGKINLRHSFQKGYQYYLLPPIYNQYQGFSIKLYILTVIMD
jgi:hypothetical protein